MDCVKCVSYRLHIMIIQVFVLQFRLKLLEHKHQCALLERDTKMYMSLAQNTISVRYVHSFLKKFPAWIVYNYIAFVKKC